MYGATPIWQPSRDNPCYPYSCCYSSDNNDDFGILYVMISFLEFSRVSTHPLLNPFGRLSPNGLWPPCSPHNCFSRLCGFVRNAPHSLHLTLSFFPKPIHSFYWHAVATWTSPFLTIWCFRSSLLISIFNLNQLISWNIRFTECASGRIIINTNTSLSWHTHLDTNSPTINHRMTTSGCNPHGRTRPGILFVINNIHPIAAAIKPIPK